MDSPMNKLHYAPEAKNDLADIKEYISGELASPIAAKNTVSRITKRIRNLERFSDMGTPLSSIVGIDTDYRFLVCGHYLAFYRTEGNNVYINRVLYGKRDYVAILFGDLPENEPEQKIALDSD